MNTNLKKLLSAVLALSAAHLAASDSKGTGHTNKTFLTPRSQGVNLPLEFTTFNELVHRCCHDKFGANFELTGYYQASTNEDDLGRHFGVANKHKFDLGNFNGNGKTAPTDAFPVDIRDIIHDRTGGVNPATKAATIDLQPNQSVWGLTLNYHQDLDKLLCGLFIRANLPIAGVENDVDLRVTSDSADTKKRLENFFKGSFEGIDAANKMKKLTAGKIDGKQSETGVADIDVALGYKFYNQDYCFVSLAIALTIPTGTEADGKYLFEPLVGNGGHVGLGGDLDTMFRIWGDDCHNIDLSIVLKYRYLFESSERRVFGLKDRNWGQYIGLAQDGDNAVTPAANALCLNTDITPGSQLDAIVNFAYNNCGFTVDLGYNMFFKERESAHLKTDIAKGSKKWYVAARNWDTNTAFDNTNANHAETVTKNLTNSDLSTASVETPSQWTHTIYAGLGYTFVEWEYPLLMGVGGKYEFGDRSALENWSVWAKVGVGF